jgi:DNA repair exonuclease SbcCD nuclease subunit
MNNKYLTVLITDTHFGAHNCSLTWLKSQKEFFDKQFIPHLKKRKKEGYNVRVIHCGDVFDSRSTINTYIATTVVDLFSQICEIVDRFYIVAGNHDYYSPESDNVDTVRLMFKQLELKYGNSCFNIISQMKFSDTWCEDGKNVDLFVPWYEWIKHDDLVEYLENFRTSCEDGVDITHIFTHADLIREKTDIECKNIVSGHIHTPYFKDNIKNLGSVFALTFTDNNTARGFYEYEGGDGDLQFIENKHSIRFWRFYDDEVLDIPKEVKKEDYIEIYISKSKIAQKTYADAYAKWVKKFKNIWRVPQIDEGDEQEVTNIKKFEGYNIENMTESLIPDELKPKFTQIKQYINSIKD